MGHGNNDDLRLVRSVEYVERESLNNEFPGSVFSHGRELRSISDPRNGTVNRVCEGCSTQRTSLEVPATRFSKLASSLRMKPNSH
ncbi:MAG: hypothetical protein QOK48_3190 [Blastocatellia bacterium]|jgi:hypothetical protein|nr:hypothetical protein [Blastocatellia bacterium]